MAMLAAVILIGLAVGNFSVGHPAIGFFLIAVALSVWTFGSRRR